MLRLTMLCASLLVLSGCAANQLRVGVEFCDHARPIMWDSDAELDATPMPITRQIVMGNEKFEALCKQK